MSEESRMWGALFVELAPWIFRAAVVIGAFFWFGWRGAACAILGGLRLTVKP